MSRGEEARGKTPRIPIFWIQVLSAAFLVSAVPGQRYFRPGMVFSKK
jgi:hypothetical protein